MEQNIFIVSKMKLLLMFCFPLVQGVYVEETAHFSLTCPKEIPTEFLKIGFGNGPNESLANFSDSGCSVYQADVVCYHFINTDKVVVAPVTIRSRKIVSYSCNSEAIQNISYFAKPTNISCERPGLDGSGENVVVTCRTSKIFPEAGCTFFDLTNQVILKRKFVTVQQTAYGSPTYYQAECNLTLPISTLFQDRMQVQVLIYPAIDNGTKYGVNYTIRPDILLEQVSIGADSNCLQGPNNVDGYIKSGTEASCICYKTSPGDTIARLNWYDGDTLISLNQTDPSISKLTVSYPRDFNKTYHCRVIPLAADSRGLELTPKFAYGPSKVYVSPTHVNINVCQPLTSSVRISCWAAKNDVSPDVTIEISTDRPDILKASIVTETNASMINVYNIHIKALKGGKYSFNCSLSNTIFNEFNAVETVLVTANEPPKDQPILIINGGQPIKEGITSDNVNVTCSAPGGYPPVSNLTMVCLGQTIFAEGTYFSLKMSLTRNFIGSECSCTANHISGCYENKTAKRLIDMIFKVNITRFTGNNASVLEVLKGDSVMFECSAESNPQPVFMIQTKDRREARVFSAVMETTEVAKHNWVAKYFWKNMTCVDTNTYICVTENTYNEIQAKTSLLLLVKCPMQILHDERRAEDFQIEIVKHAVLTFEVFGHPKPTRFELMRKKPEIVIVGFEKYTVTFSESEHPYGNITLTLRHLEMNDLGLYILLVDNNIDKALEIRFRLITESGASDDSAGKIAGGAVGTFGFMIIIIVGIVCYKRKKQYGRLWNN